jgi:hypothetical protein
MDRAWNTHGRELTSKGHLKERDHEGDPDVDERIRL